MEREPSGFPFLETNNMLMQLKCLQLVKKWFYHFLTIQCHSVKGFVIARQSADWRGNPFSLTF